MPTFLSLALLVLTCSGCVTGPSYCGNKVNDFFDGIYKDEPVLAGAITDVVPVYFLAKVVAFIPDFLVLNPVQFWAFDIWRGEGAAFKHKPMADARSPWFVSDPPKPRKEFSASR